MNARESRQPYSTFRIRVIVMQGEPPRPRERSAPGSELRDAEAAKYLIGDKVSIVCDYDSRTETEEIDAASPLPILRVDPVSVPTYDEINLIQMQISGQLKPVRVILIEKQRRFFFGLIME